MVSIGWFIFWVVVSFLSDIVFFAIWFARRFVGTLIVDRTDPETDKYNFQVDDLDKMSKRNYVVLKVKCTKTDDSRK